MVLLDLFLRWRRGLRCELGVVHVHHGLRGADADGDAALVRETCAAHAVPCYVEHVDSAAVAAREGLSLEAAGRRLRDACFERIATAHGFDRVATAHHLDDQAETILMRLLRGTGIEGLSGIHLRLGRLIRPLLFAERAELRDYARHHGVAFRHDASNDDTTHLRNRVRHRLLPLLREEFGLTDLDHFYALGMVAGAWREALDEAVTACVETDVERLSENKFRLEIATFRGYFPGVQFQVLERLLADLSGQPVSLSFRQFHAFCQWLDNPTGRTRFQFQRHLVAVRRAGRLTFEQDRRSDNRPDVDAPLSPGEAFVHPTAGYRVRLEAVSREAVRHDPDPACEFVDGDRIHWPLRIRSVRSGDRIRPVGMTGRKAVRKLIAEQPDRGLGSDEWLVLENGGEIVALVGARIDQRYRIQSGTRTVVKLETEWA